MAKHIFQRPAVWMLLFFFFKVLAQLAHGGFREDKVVVVTLNLLDKLFMPVPGLSLIHI